MFRMRVDNERGAFNTVGALIAVALVAIAITMGTSFYRSTSTLSANTQVHARERIEVASLKEQFRQDANLAQSIYFPSAASPLGALGCAASGPCDQIRFAVQRPDKTWTFWGYYSDPTNDKVYRCGYVSSEATTCTGTIALDGAVTFRAQAVPATTIAASIPTFASSGVTDYIGNLSYTATDSRVVGSNRVMVVQFANSTAASEVHLIGNPRAAKVALLHGSYDASARGIAAVNTSAGGTTFSFANASAAAQNGEVSEDRYNDVFGVGAVGGPYVAPGSYACMSGGTTVATVSFGALNHTATSAIQQPNSGTVSVQPFSVSPNSANGAGGSCTFNLHSAKSNPGDAADVPLTVVLNPTYGPVVVTASTLTTTANGSTTGSISQSQWSGPYTIASSTCAGIASVSISGSTLNVVGGPTGNTSCSVTVAGAPFTTSAVVPINIKWPAMNPGSGNSSAATATSLNLTTSAPNGGNGSYTVSYAFQGSGSPIAGCASIAINATCTISGLTPSTTYNFVPTYNDTAGASATGIAFSGKTTAPVSTGMATCSDQPAGTQLNASYYSNGTRCALVVSPTSLTIYTPGDATHPNSATFSMTEFHTGSTISETTNCTLSSISPTSYPGGSPLGQAGGNVTIVAQPGVTGICVINVTDSVQTQTVSVSVLSAGGGSTPTPAPTPTATPLIPPPATPTPTPKFIYFASGFHRGSTNACVKNVSGSYTNVTAITYSSSFTAVNTAVGLDVRRFDNYTDDGSSGSCITTFDGTTQSAGPGITPTALYLAIKNDTLAYCTLKTGSATCSTDADLFGAALDEGLFEAAASYWASVPTGAPSSYFYKPNGTSGGESYRGISGVFNWYQD